MWGGKSLAWWKQKLNPTKTHPVKPPKKSAVEQYIGWWRWGIANRAHIGYSMFGPRLAGEKDKPGTLPLLTDCSGLTYVFADWAGLKLPYNGSGNTNTLMSQCAEVTFRTAEPGDLIVYGPRGNTHHVVTILARLSATDFTCGSHGSAENPCREVLHSAEAQWQSEHGYPGVTFLRIPR